MLLPNISAAGNQNLLNLSPREADANQKTSRSRCKLENKTNKPETPLPPNNTSKIG
jgi:hypothetical protein